MIQQGSDDDEGGRATARKHQQHTHARVGFAGNAAAAAAAAAVAAAVAAAAEATGGFFII